MLFPPLCRFLCINIQHWFSSANHSGHDEYLALAHPCRGTSTVQASHCGIYVWLFWLLNDHSGSQKCHNKAYNSLKSIQPFVDAVHLKGHTVQSEHVGGGMLLVCHVVAQRKNAKDGLFCNESRGRFHGETLLQTELMGLRCVVRKGRDKRERR